MMATITITPGLVFMSFLALIGLAGFIRILCTKEGREFLNKLFKAFFLLK